MMMTELTPTGTGFGGAAVGRNVRQLRFDAIARVFVEFRQLEQHLVQIVYK